MTSQPERATDGPTHSATALASFLECSHLAVLSRAVNEGLRPRPPKYDDPAFEALLRRGAEHEEAYQRGLEAGGLEVVRIQPPDCERGTGEYWRRYTEATLGEMKRGAQVIAQGGLRAGPWAGIPDFLLRFDQGDGTWTYEVVDAKLARGAKGRALIQVLLYAHLVEAVHGRMPEHVSLALAGPDARTERFRVTEYAAYFRTVRDQFLAFQAGFDGQVPSAPDPVEHCRICAWRGTCADERREADHLSLVAGIRTAQSQALRRAEVPTLSALAGLASDASVPDVTRAGLVRIREQARIQLEGRQAGRMLHELLPLEPERGLSALPEPSPGDLFLDFEANPFVLGTGIEYLFGLADADGNYTARWAVTRGEERTAFEWLIDFVEARRAEWPDLHVYHYAPYEETALKRLMGFHGSREAEMDHLLRGKVLIDLHRVVRQALRASVESYSIKKLEPLYGFVREQELRAASGSLAAFDALLEDGRGASAEAEAPRQVVECYNRDDCLSARALRGWLESLRSEQEAANGAPLPRPSPEPETEGAEPASTEARLRMERLVALAAEADDPAPLEMRPRWLLAQLLEFHRREHKSFWWKYFNWRKLSEPELIEDREAVGGARYVGVVGEEKKSLLHRYEFPAQVHGLKVGQTVHDPWAKMFDPEANPLVGTVFALDDLAGTVDLKRDKSEAPAQAAALVPYEIVGDDDQRASLLRTADRALEDGLLDHPSASADLLLRRPPRTRGAAPLALPGETATESACRLVTELDCTVLAVQGPPGAGKTYTAGRMIVRAVEAGLRVGITATSHKVISNLLGQACAAAREAGVSFKALQRASQEDACSDPWVTVARVSKSVPATLAAGEAQVVAGTPWLWARADMTSSVDVLFIDEAGQFSLANAMAVAPAAESLVMLGDPRQLEQPRQGVHPPGSEVSALTHLLDGHVTLPVDRGLFLERTWRLHPSICGFTSELFYEGRLRPREGLEVQSVGAGALTGSGLWLLPVLHQGKQAESPEEAGAVAALMAGLLDGGRWTDEFGSDRALTLSDILVVAPYNAQVAALAAALPPGARIGTVDRFQGQEAAVVIYSAATSTPEDAPRGMEFLYSPNRLNVATSRARCAVVMVASPALFLPGCRSPAQMRLANPFCRFRELAFRLAQLPDQPVLVTLD